MSRAKRPVSIDGLEFDALMREERSLTATVPQYPTESGFSVSDSVIFGVEQLNMVLYVTNTPVTWLSRHGSDRGRVEQVCKELENKYYKGEPVTIITSDKTYKNMVITSIKFSKTLETGYSREIPVIFKQIRITKAKSTTIPKLYGKSGTTAAQAGSANTSTGTAGGSTTSSGSNTKPGNRSSVLHGIASSIGMIK